MMILAPSLQERIIKTKSLRFKLSVALNFTSDWILTQAKRNKDNGPLTTFAAMEVIREETKLADEEILVASTV